MRWLVLLVVGAALLPGCVTQTRMIGQAPGLEPPPARSGEGITREQALAITREDDSERAIQRLDAARFSFGLDAGTAGWFEREATPAEVVDYLKKPRRVDWEGLRGDVDPATPEREYIDPRRGFDDWAGFGRRESYASTRSRDPFGR